MTTMPPNQDSRQGPTAGHQGVLCTKCDHLNAAHLDICERCGSHLYVACPRCGRRHRRVSSRCTDCGARLHRSVWRRWRRWISKRRSKITPAHIGLAIVLAYAVYRVIVKLAEYSPSPPQ
jgi:Double zinc ribbon